MNIASQIIEARGGDVIVDVQSRIVTTVEEAALLFGLATAPGTYVEVGEREAEAVLVSVLTEDMAYRCPLVAPDQAARLAREFIVQFADEKPRFYTNGEYGKPRERSGVGPSWTPATEATFDTGILVVTSERTACAWFMDED